MKKVASIFILILLASVAYSQTPAPPAPPAQTAPPVGQTAGQTLPELLNWMVGEWEGEGMSRGEREFIGKLSVMPELDGTALLVRRESTTKEEVSGGLKELIIVGFDGTTKKIVATVYDNKNSIGLYVGELKTNEVVFSAATAQQGYVSRRIYKLMPDGGLSFIIEGATPGKEVSKVVEINFKKKS